MASSSDRCEHCGERLTWARTGRPRRFCSATCRQRAHRARPRQLAIGQVLDVVAPAADDGDGSRCSGCGVGITRSTWRGLCGSCLPDPFAGADHS